MKGRGKGRFKKEMAPSALNFTASLSFDRRLAEHDIRGSKAHVKMLSDCGVIGARDAAAIREGLDAIDAELREGRFPFDPECEDIHMNIEKRLTVIIGPSGGMLHTARSRNDQVALDMHLFMLEEIGTVERLVRELQEQILDAARRNEGVVMPGYTHLQRAQPVLFSHHLLAYFWMLQRDRERLQDARRRADMMPLGAGALAGTGFPIDREMVARELGFSRLYENSMDAVSDRDYLVEFLGCAALLMMHFSRLSEELVLWSSSEFNFIELDEAYSTGSSMMPQKKNPDVPELVRGKTGRVYGHLVALLTVLKGLPLAYNRDLQEDKEGLFDTVDTLKAVLPLAGELIKTMKVNRHAMAAAVRDDYHCATDLADYLVRRGLAFREAHRITGSLIAYCKENGMQLKELEPERRGSFHPALGEDLEGLLDPVRVVEARRCRGGTSAAAVREQLLLAGEALRKQ